MRKDLRKEDKNYFEKYFLKLMNNAVFRKFMENVRKRMAYMKIFEIRIKLSYNKFFFWKSISSRNEKTQICMNKPVYLELSILELTKILIYEFWYDYVKLNYRDKARPLTLYT